MAGRNAIEAPGRRPARTEQSLDERFAPGGRTGLAPGGGESLPKLNLNRGPTTAEYQPPRGLDWPGRGGALLPKLILDQPPEEPTIDQLRGPTLLPATPPKYLLHSFPPPPSPLFISSLSAIKHITPLPCIVPFANGKLCGCGYVMRTVKGGGGGCHAVGQRSRW